MVAARVTPEEHAAWQEKAAGAGVTPSTLLREAMAWTWTAPAQAIERERIRQIARIGNNLNQLARWANTHKTAAEAVSVIAHLVSFERSLRAVTRFDEDGGRLSRRRAGRRRAQPRGLSLLQRGPRSV